MLSREQITNYKPKKKTITTEQGEVLIREMSSSEYFEYLEVQTDSLTDDGKTTIDGALMVKVAMWCLLNEDGSQMFAAGEMDEVGKIEPGTLFAIYIAAAEMSGISIEKVAAAKKN